MTPIVFVPGLLCSAEVFSSQVIALWPYAPVTVANTLDGKTISEISATILSDAPARFALVSISMGGYICLEIMRQAPERVVKLALLDTSARADTPEETKQRLNDPALSEVNLRMGLAVGAEGLARQAEAASGANRQQAQSRGYLRPDSRDRWRCGHCHTASPLGRDRERNSTRSACGGSGMWSRFDARTTRSS